LNEKSVYRVKDQKFVSIRNVASTSADFRKRRTTPDAEDDVVFQHLLDFRLPDCSSSIVPDCEVKGFTVTHQFHFLFTIATPMCDTERVQVKVSLGVRLLSCRCVDDFLSLPNYDENSYYCPCNPVHQRLARLVLGDAAVEQISKPPPDYDGLMAADFAASSVRSVSPLPKNISVNDEGHGNGETITL
jgi:hypothetical protein